MAFHLQKYEALDRGLTRIALEQIEKIIVHLEDDSMPLHERVHSMRSRCKRLRALLRLARPAMTAQFKAEDERFRAAGRRLCHLRDAHVLGKTTADFEDHLRAEIDVPDDAEDFDPALLKKSLEDMHKARLAAGHWKLDARGFYDIAAGLGRTYDNARRAWRRALEEPTDEHFHRLRRWAKYLLFQVMILKPVKAKRLGPLRRELDRLGDELGLGHDLAVLEHSLLESGNSSEALMQHVHERKQARYDGALTLCEKTLSGSTDRFVADVAGWWADWQS